ncbi:MAG: hypothetical protein E6Q59_08355 [Nitrosomonas sp.]|nr:MAG: hypothetical protein E6Q59_08355 [Nitrosomonas sp.]
MLDIIIAIFLIYALFAGMVSGINEFIIQMLSLRGKVLFEGIAMMLGELPQKTYKLGILKPFFIRDAKVSEDLYRHPLIDSLSPSGCSRPSYISPQTFSTALVQVLSKDGSLTALRQSLDDRNTPLGKLFGPMLDEASGDLEGFKAKVEAHFNAVTDRVNGWFKRRTQFVMFFIGLLLAISFNVDSIHIVQQLERNPAKVQELVKIAGDVKEKVAEVSKPNNPPDQAKTLQGIVKDNNELIERMDKFNSMGLPIGWYLPNIKPVSEQHIPETASLKENNELLSKEYLESIEKQLKNPMKWLGWFITALAGTLGAPFWFDAISKLFAIRGAGKRPEETTSPAAPPVSVQVSTPATASSTNPQDTPLNDYEASRLNGDDIEGLQRALGMPAAKIDGRLSEELRQLLREWQRVNGKIATGQFDESTVLALLYPENKGN